MHRRALHGSVPDDVDLVELVADQRDREDLTRIGCRLDVDGENAELGAELAGAELRIDEASQAGLEGLGDSLDLDARAETAIDQVTVREADVGLQRFPARIDHGLAQMGDVSGDAGDDAQDGAALEIPEVARLDARVTLGRERRGRLRMGEEVGLETIVLDKERPAVPQPTEQLDQRPTRALRARRLQDEAHVAHSRAPKPPPPGVSMRMVSPASTSR